MTIFRAVGLGAHAGVRVRVDVSVRVDASARLRPGVGVGAAVRYVRGVARLTGSGAHHGHARSSDAVSSLATPLSRVMRVTRVRRRRPPTRVAWAIVKSRDDRPSSRLATTLSAGMIRPFASTLGAPA